MVGRVPLGSSISSWFVMYLLVLILAIFANIKFKDKKITFGTLLEPVLALPEAPVNFEDLSFVDHPPTAATLLLLADEPVSEDEDF